MLRDDWALQGVRLPLDKKRGLFQAVTVTRREAYRINPPCQPFMSPLSDALELFDGPIKGPVRALDGSP